MGKGIFISLFNIKVFFSLRKIFSKHSDKGGFMLLEKLKLYHTQPKVLQDYLQSNQTIKASDLLEQDSKTKVNALTYAAARLDIEPYQALMAKVSFVEKLKLYLFHPQVFQSYVAQATVITDDELCQMHEELKQPALIFAGSILSVKDYAAMADKISDQTIEKLILEKREGCGLTLHIALAFADSGISKLLLKKVSPIVFNSVAYKPEILPLLHIAAKNLNQENFQTVLSIISIEVLKKVLPIQNDEGETVMHLAARHQGQSNFELLSDRVKTEAPEAYKTAMLQQDKEGWTAFACVMVHQGSKALQKAIIRLGSAAVNEAMLLKTSIKLNRRPSNPEVHKEKYRLWVGKNSRQSCYSSNGLHLAAQFLDSKGFRILLSSVSRETLCKALIKRDSLGRTPLQIIDRYQDNDSIDMLLLLVEPSAIETARISDTSSGYKWTKFEMKNPLHSIVSHSKHRRSREVADAEEFDITPFLKAASKKIAQKMVGPRPLPLRPSR
jgi:ankyrin repeat protein